MAGAALSRMWDTNPKLAFVLHLLSSGGICLLAVLMLSDGRLWGIGIFAGLFGLLDVAILVMSTIDAAKRGWTRSEY